MHNTHNPLQPLAVYNCDALASLAEGEVWPCYSPGMHTCTADIRHPSTPCTPHTTPRPYSCPAKQHTGQLHYRHMHLTTDHANTMLLQHSRGTAAYC
jgi:hypothetical protein